MHQVATMQDKVWHTFIKQPTKYARCYEKKVYTLPKYTIGQQVYVNSPPNAFIADDKKTLTEYEKLLSGTTGPFAAMDVRGNVTTIDENGIPIAISMDRATSVPTKNHMTIWLISILDSSPRTRVSQNTDTECKKPSEYVAEKVVDHNNTSEKLMYRECWSGCTSRENALKPTSCIPRHFIRWYLNLLSKKRGPVEVQQHQVVTKCRVCRAELFIDSPYYPEQHLRQKQPAQSRTLQVFLKPVL